jgi:hypothetical protein
MGFVAYLGLNLFAPLFNEDTLVGIFFQGFFAGILGIIAGVIILILLKSKELSEARNTIHKKFWKAKIVAESPEIV